MATRRKSFKREAAWVLIVWWMIFAAYLVSDDVTAPEADLIVGLALPIIAFLAMAYGMEWHATQSPWVCPTQSPPVLDDAPDGSGKSGVAG